VRASCGAQSETDDRLLMLRIDATSQAIDALITAGAHEAASDMLRSELGPLSAHFGHAQVARWCDTLGLAALLDLPLAIESAHSVRETQGTPAIVQFMAIVRTARTRGDDVAEFRALAGVYCTGILAWSGFGDMQREFSRINQLLDVLHARLSDDDAVECLPGLLVARLLFGKSAADSAQLGEALVKLVFDEQLSGTARLRAATMLAPWFNFSRDAVRMSRTAESLAPLEADSSISLITRVIYRAAITLAQTHLGVYVSTNDTGLHGLRINGGKPVTDDDSNHPQWLRFFVRRNAFELASRGNNHALAADRLDELEAIVNPAEPSQVLLVRYGRSRHAMRACEYAVALASAQRCMELVRALEMPETMAALYQAGVAGALLGLNRLAESHALYTSLLVNMMPGQRLVHERMCALIDATTALDQYEAALTNGGLTAEDARVNLRARLADYLRLSGGRLMSLETQTLPLITNRLVAALFAHDLGTEVFAEDLQVLRLMPPASRPVYWPWSLRIRLFDGFAIEGATTTAMQESSTKGESKSMQILQYLAAHAPAAVSAQRMADSLWPEAEGDKAMRSLDVALTRLRQQLPDATLLVRSEGKICFDLKRVWCDTHAALVHVNQLRERANPKDVRTGSNLSEVATGNATRDHAQAHIALDLLSLYRGPALPDSREAFARDRAAFFRSQVAGAAQIGLRSAIRLSDSTIAEEIVRKSVAHGLPADVVRSVLNDLQSCGEDASQRAVQLTNVFELARA
jgi:hypothetical protein